MNQELCQYLVPDVIEWLIKNIIEQPTLLSKFIKYDDEFILHKTLNSQYIYTYSHSGTVRKYDLLKSEIIDICVLQGARCTPLFQSIQHPHLIGFLRPRNILEYEIDLIGNIFEYEIDLIVIDTGLVTYTWDVFLDEDLYGMKIWDY